MKRKKLIRRIGRNAGEIFAALCELTPSDSITVTLRWMRDGSSPYIIVNYRWSTRSYTHYLDCSQLSRKMDPGALTLMAEGIWRKASD